MKKKADSVFSQWVLNNRFSVGLINVLLTLIIILVFNRISFIFDPVNVFLGAVMPPVIVALLQYYLMNPVVNRLEKRFKVPRTITILAIFALVTLLIIWMINSMIPVVQNQINSLVKNWPAIWKNATEAIDDLLSKPKLSGLRDSIQKQLTSLQKDMNQLTGSAVSNAFSNLTNAVNVAASVFTTLATAPFILFFMLKDGSKLRPYLAHFAPKRWEQATSSLLSEVNRAMSSYVRGQVSVAICVGIMFFIGYTIIGEPYGAALAIAVGCLNLIPYFGTFLGLIPALIIASVTSIPLLVNVLIVFFVEQLVETRIISPLIVGNRLKMHPVTTIVVMLGAGSVWGLLGVIGGIPMYAVAKILVSHLFAYYKKVSHLYADSLTEQKAPENGQKEERENS